MFLTSVILITGTLLAGNWGVMLWSWYCGYWLLGAKALSQGVSCTHQYESYCLAPELSPRVLKRTASRRATIVLSAVMAPTEEQICDAVLPIG